MRAKAAVLFTGGKDSCLALLKARKKYEIKYLLAILPSSHDSYMFHKPSLLLLKAQAKSLEIPLLTQKSKAEKEKELGDLEKLLRKVKDKISYIITGSVASSYQEKRIKKIAKKLGFKVVMPLWSYSAEQLWKEALRNKFKIILTKIACEGLPKEMLGKEIDNEALAKIINLNKKYHFTLTGEGGDFETAVFDMPLFNKKIEIKIRIRSESPYRHFLIIKKVKLKKEREEIKK